MPRVALQQGSLRIVDTGGGYTLEEHRQTAYGDRGWALTAPGDCKQEELYDLARKAGVPTHGGRILRMYHGVNAMSGKFTRVTELRPAEALLAICKRLAKKEGAE